MALSGPAVKSPGIEDPSLPSTSAAAHAGTANVAVNVGPQEGRAKASDGKPQLVTWWPIILFALTLAAAAGGLYFEVKDHTRDIDALKQDVKSVSDEVNLVDRKMDLLLIRQGIDPTAVKAR